MNSCLTSFNVINELYRHGNVMKVYRDSVRCYAIQVSVVTFKSPHQLTRGAAADLAAIVASTIEAAVLCAAVVLPFGRFLDVRVASNKT